MARHNGYTQGEGPASTGSANREATSLHDVEAIVEAVRLARTLASQAGAAFYGVFADHASQPVICIDSEFPKVSATSRRICTADDAWPRRQARPLDPVWWHGEAGNRTDAGSRRFILARAIAALTPNLPGIALPVYCRSGSGFVVFAGHGLTLDDAALCELHRRCFPLFAAARSVAQAHVNGFDALSSREVQCLQLTADGRTSEEIAAQLGLSVHTVNRYLAASTQKLNAVSRVHAVAKAMRMSIVE
ncbi:helix-turn-helix transcriptional regulator [Mesorhizobium xinjiangense]|uniref:helix-turn-helix transcriptional regulator n=1 Tax=Mesorhizobium xinjiangense TaxID=2678685 RepID=UPI0012ED7991|nr:helix-turn-helix transcriptional regulator [Mesorhizobium xinjiangense]